MHPALPAAAVRSIQGALLLTAAIFLGLHYVHLRADFPNYSPWMDWSKYTDEGWYGDAAIRHFQIGHWYVPGDFNPAAALPVWPFVEALLFQFTGVSLAAARGLTVTVFAGILVCSFLLVRRWSRGKAFAPATSVLLLALSPFCFVFTRLAILEPLLILWTLLAMLAASAAGRPRRLLPALALGTIVPLMILTKTTALFLLPAVAWLLFASFDYRLRPFLRTAVPACGLAAALWLAYFLLGVRPHYLLDYRYLFSANAYTGITPANALSVLGKTVRDGVWMGGVLFPLAMAACAVSFASLRRLRDLPLIPSLMLWAGGYVAFLAYHNNLQPRYYLVVAVPLTLLVPYVFEQLIWDWLVQHLPQRRACAAALVGFSIGVAAMAVPDARQTLGFVQHPEYTLVDAAQSIREFIDADHARDPAHNPLVLSISGSDLSLMTGLHSICDDFGTLELAARVKRYRPGWYVAWNQIDDDKMDALMPVFHVERVAVFPAMDDPERNLLILYRLNEAAPSQPNPHPVKPTPKRLRTRVGQQPSVEQLVH